MAEMTRVTTVTDDRDMKEYQRGDIGQPLKAINDDRWLLCCPLCGTISTLHSAMIVKHEDGTVSTTPPLLYCHGRYAFRQYRIEHNRVFMPEERKRT